MTKPTRLSLRTLSFAALWLGCSCHAQTNNAQFYGVIDLSATSRQLAGNARTTEVMNGAMTTSFLGVRGSEDLGGGFNALFSLESFLRADTGDAGRVVGEPYWARNAWVGLSSTMGTLRLGRQSTPSFLLAGRTNPFGGATGVGPFLMHTYMPSATQPMLTGSGTSDSAWSNAVGLSSRDFGGLSVSLLGTAAEGSTAGRRLSVGVNYSAGALLAGVAVDKLSNLTLPWGAPAPVLATAARPLFTASEVTTVLAGASWDFGPARGFAQFYRAGLDAANGSTLTLKTTQLGATVRTGAGNMLASWAHTAKDQPNTRSQRRDTVAVGYDHLLSKRTDAYLVVLRDRVSDLSSGTSIGLGVRHSF